MSTARPQNRNILSSALLKNSLWGMVSSILQILFVLLFFIIIARKYNTDQFAEFLIATTVYQIVAAFSSMGLGQWFIRQYVNESDRISFTGKFLKTQAGLGLVFYFINILVAFLLYPDSGIRLLCIILGTNILFDNMINAIKTLNIAENQQRKTAVILVGDGFLKMLAGCLLFLYAMPPALLAGIMIFGRILTLGFFIRIGSSNSVSISIVRRIRVSGNDLRNLVVKNWRFMVIGSISIIYWRIGNIIISKMLSLTDVANYEVAFRIFSVFLIFPLVASATVFPRMVRIFTDKGFPALRTFYNYAFTIYSIFSVLAYAFIYCFAEIIIKTTFGEGYSEAAKCLKLMFLTYLLFPTVLLQANLLVAIGLEKLDMWFNIASLGINVAGCFAGLYFFRDLSVVNYAVFSSFIAFLLMQDIVLTRKKIITLGHSISVYAILVLVVLSFDYLVPLIHPYVLFPAFLLILGGITGIWYFRNYAELLKLSLSPSEN